MRYEFHAHFPFALQDAVTQAAAIDFLAHKRDHPPQAWPELAQVEDDGARMALLSQTLVTGYKDQARTGARNDPGGYAFWLKRAAAEFLARQRRWLDGLNLAQSSRSLPDLALLPTGSFAVHCTFRLSSPYLSKDDAALHLLDNPLKKEWVFKLPYIASTQWKGALQATMVQQLVQWWQGLNPKDQQQRTMQKRFVAQRIQLTRLFGTEIDNVQNYLCQCAGHKTNQWYTRYVRRFLSRTGFLAGRLYFYPTFFGRLSLEVINPHDRKTGAGSQPILMETVPAGTTGQFTLLYAPLDRIGQDESETRQQVAADLQLVAAGLEALFTLYGFGAKTSSGFGLAQERVGAGALTLRSTALPAAPTPSPTVESAPIEALARYLEAPGRLRPEFRNPDGSFRQRTEAEVKAMKKADRQLYDKAKSWWEREGKELAEGEPEPPTPEVVPVQTPEWPSWPFATFAALVDVAGQAASLLTKGETQ